MPCDAAITDDAAMRIYDRLLVTQGTDGCTLEDVVTDKSAMVVHWKARGSPLPEAAELVVKECASPDAVVGPVFSIRVPESLRAACPSTIPAAIAVVQREAFAAPPLAFTWRNASLAAVVTMTLVLLFFLERRRRRISASNA